MSFGNAEKALLTIKEFCYQCNIGYTKYREEVVAGRIETISIGLRGIRIHRDEISNWPMRCSMDQVEGE